MLSSTVRDLFRRSSPRPSQRASPTFVPAENGAEPRAEAPMAEVRFKPPGRPLGWR